MERLSRPPRRAFAMGMFVVMLALMTAVTSVVLFTVDAERKSSGAETRRASARALANSALEDFYANLLANPDSLTAGTTSEGWFALTPAGRATCAGLEDDCYRVDVTAQLTEPGRSSASTVVRQASATATVTVRTGCRGSAARCQFTRLTQKLRQRSFFDFLHYTKFNALDPSLYTTEIATSAGFATPADATAACANRYASRTNIDVTPNLAPRDARCLSVSYQGNERTRDVVAGPVYTFDDYVSACGNPVFEGPLYAVGAGVVPAGQSGPQPWRQVGGVCTSWSATPAAVAPSTPGGTVVGAAPVELPSAQSATEIFRTLAGRRLSGPVTLSFAAGGMVVGSAAPSPVPDVVFVEGDATIQASNVPRSITIYASGTLTVTGDVCVTALCADSDLGAFDETRPMVGLAAGSGIRIAQAPPGETRHLHATLVAFDGSITVSDWSVPRADFGAPPALRLVGATVGRYQGVYGGYDDGTGDLESGYEKDFAYDPRLATGLLQPPYLLAPLSRAGQQRFDVASSWDRIDASEVPITPECKAELQRDSDGATNAAPTPPQACDTDGVANTTSTTTTAPPPQPGG